ncbi:MAG: NAD-dependent epimerase/dehydratase family protein [Thermoanaerobaculia bacterium]
MGSAVAEHLSFAGRMRAETWPLFWEEDARLEQLRRIETRIGATAVDRDAPLAIVWSAGRAGFEATPAEAEAELKSFAEVLALGRRVRDRFPRAPVHFLLFSSAGGLFEGQVQITGDSRPAPRRPYGDVKLAEEEMLKSGAPGVRKTILRLSSVYGRIRRGHRSGLISTLLFNGMQRRVSRIVGSMSTLRDFIWAEDVAGFAARRILSVRPQAEISEETLASGRPTSILEARKLVEDVLRHAIFVSHSTDPSNRADITFSPGLRPRGWRPGRLETHLRILSQQALGIPADSLPQISS